MISRSIPASQSVTARTYRMLRSTYSTRGTSRWIPRRTRLQLWYVSSGREVSRNGLACSRSKRSGLCAISATCGRAPSSAVTLSAVIEPEDTGLAFAMPDEVEVNIREEVRDRLGDRSEE